MYLPDLSSTSWATVPFPVTPDEFVAAGFYTAGDGGGGTFIWIVNPNPSPTTPLYIDGGITFGHPTDSVAGESGCFKRIYSGPINVRWFGAKGDDVANDTAAVKKAIIAAANTANNSTIYFPKGDYRLPSLPGLRNETRKQFLFPLPHICFHTSASISIK